MATIRRGNRGTQHPLVKLEVAGRTVQILSANGNIDHQVVFNDTAEMIEFALVLLGNCPAMELYRHPKMQQYARAAATQLPEEEPHDKVQRFKDSPSGINITGTQTGRTQCERVPVPEEQVEKERRYRETFAELQEYRARYPQYRDDQLFMLMLTGIAEMDVTGEAKHGPTIPESNWDIPTNERKPTAE